MNAKTAKASLDLERLLAEEIDDVSRYAQRAVGVLRQVTSAPAWMRVYERGLREAYRRSDMDGLAAMVALAALRFDAEGRLDEGLAHLDFALAMGEGLPDARVLLESMKAEALGIRGDVDGARRALRSAERALPKATSPRAASEFGASAAALACITCDVARLPKVRAAIGAAEQAGEHRLAMYVMSWLIPMMFAVGEKDQADPWVHALRTHAEEIGHPYRLADAEVFAFARAAAWGPTDVAPPLQRVTDSGNALGAYRLEGLRLRHATLTGDWAVAERALTKLGRLAVRMSRGYGESLPAFEAVVEAYRSTSERPLELTPPARASLPALGGVLAAAEAVAIAGTQRGAGRWLTWIEQSLPLEIRTSIEWPVARDRVVGLLQVRAGSVRAAVGAFRAAIQWAGRAGYEAEAALARVQLAEVMSLTEIASSERARTRLRRAGWMKLQELEIDPTPHAYGATRALAQREDVATRPQLTPRQVEVLSLLAEGLTYRETADRLGTSWRTVSTQAYQAYERLGVEGKWEAVSTARRLRIL